MESTAYIGLSRQGVLRNEMAAIAHNLANVNTTGFKKERMLFVDHLVNAEGADQLVDRQLAYVRDIASFRDLSEGPLKQTSNPLDLAIHGDGFFVVSQGGQDFYTRNGSLRLDEGGQLVTQQGDPVLTDAGTPIFLSPQDTQITIAQDGTVSSENGTLGRLRVVTFDNPRQLERAAAGYYTTNQVPVDVAQPRVEQGMLEGSNVEAVLEMVRMIDVSRMYKAAHSLLEREDDRIRRMVQTLGSRQQG